MTLTIFPTCVRPLTSCQLPNHLSYICTSHWTCPRQGVIQPANDIAIWSSTKISFWDMTYNCMACSQNVSTVDIHWLMSCPRVHFLPSTTQKRDHKPHWHPDTCRSAMRWPGKTTLYCAVLNQINRMFNCLHSEVHASAGVMEGNRSRERLHPMWTDYLK